MGRESGDWLEESVRNSTAGIGNSLCGSPEVGSIRRRKDGKKTVDVSASGQVPRTLKAALGRVAMFLELREGTVPSFFLTF